MESVSTTGILGWSRWQEWPAQVHRSFVGTRWWLRCELGPDADGRDDRAFVELDLTPVTETGWQSIGVMTLTQAEIGCIDWDVRGQLIAMDPVQLGQPFSATVIEQSVPQWLTHPAPPTQLHLPRVDSILFCLDDLPDGPDVTDHVQLDLEGQVTCWLERGIPCWEERDHPEGLPLLTGRSWRPNPRGVR